MSAFVSLDDAAKKLGLSADQLIEMRSRGEIFGYRDGASWKFKPEEIERVAGELMGEVLDEDPAGSSILSLEPDRSGLSGLSGTGLSGMTIDKGSDVTLKVDPSSSELQLVANSDLSLAEPSTGSGLSSVSDAGLRMASSDDDDDELSLASEEDEILSDVMPGSKAGGNSGKLSPSATGSGSDISLGIGSDAKSGLGLGSGSELSLAADKSGLIRGDSDPAIKPGSSGAGSDLNLSDDLQLEDDLVLGSGSDLALGADSGINLMSPADSGISLEDEPLDLAASGISGLDLAIEGSDASAGGSGISGAGSGVDFQQDEDFQLSPSGSIDTDDDSGSQVIELEDSSDFGDAAVALPAAAAGAAGAMALDAFSDNATDDALDSDGFVDMAPAAASPMMTALSVPYSTLQVLSLLSIMLLMAFGGMLMTDVIRNMWAFSGKESPLTSPITQALVQMLGK